MNENPLQAPPEIPEAPEKKPIGLALTLAFTPAILFLLLLTVMFTKVLRDPPAALWFALCVVSIILCIVSSTMLFRRRPGAILVFAILLMLLNAFVAFAFGCGALLTGMSFR